MKRDFTAEGAESAEREKEEGGETTQRILGAAIAVHRALGPGLLESAYQACLAWELDARGVRYDREVPLPVDYRGHRLDCGYRLDLVVEGIVVDELKAIERILPIHEAQMLTYLKLSGHPVGLLLNFNVPILKQGIRRFAHASKTPLLSPSSASPASSAVNPPGLKSP